MWTEVQAGEYSTLGCLAQLYGLGLMACSSFMSLSIQGWLQAAAILMAYIVAMV